VSTGYRVIPPPIGSTVTTLPSGAVDQNIDGTTYFTFGGANYRRCGHGVLPSYGWVTSTSPAYHDHLRFSASLRSMRSTAFAEPWNLPNTTPTGVPDPQDMKRAGVCAMAPSAERSVFLGASEPVS
jgi:hypothetical protein